MISRRGFLASILAGGVAPFVGRYEWLMRPRQLELVVPTVPEILVANDSIPLLRTILQGGDYTLINRITVGGKNIVTDGANIYPDRRSDYWRNFTEMEEMVEGPPIYSRGIRSFSPEYPIVLGKGDKIQARFNDDATVDLLINDEILAARV